MDYEKAFVSIEDTLPKFPTTVVLTLKPGAENYEDCDGVYEISGVLHGKPCYSYEKHQRFLAWNGFQWAISNHYEWPFITKEESIGCCCH